MLGKKSIELTINYIVVIVLTIAVLALGFYVMHILGQGGKDWIQEAKRSATFSLHQLKCGEEFLSCLTDEVVDIYNKPIGIGIKVNNRFLYDKTFSIVINGTPSNYSSHINVIHTPPSLTIKAHQSGDFVLLIKRKDTWQGTIILTVIVKQGSTTYDKHQLSINLK